VCDERQRQSDCGVVLNLPKVRTPYFLAPIKQRIGFVWRERGNLGVVP